MGQDNQPEARIDASHAQGLVIGDYASTHNTFHVHARLSAGHSSLTDIADRLANAARRQWTYEAMWRRLNDPYAMPVRWKPADPALFAGWPALVRLATSGSGWPAPPAGRWATGPTELTGTANDLVDVLGRVPTGRLVVLGEPGAGKTILLVRLVLDLLYRRVSGDPVPILLPLASWEPVGQDLFGWMERWLATEYTALAAMRPDGPRLTSARALLEAGLILPALDGLDEMPDQLRGAAIARINDAVQPGQRLVLAARTEAFDMAVRPPGGVEVRLTGAAGIELCPLDAGVVADYLRDSAGGSDSAARWDDVVATLDAAPGDAVARALTTPLMAGLARTIYNPRPGESFSSVPRHPAELLDHAEFPSRAAVEQHLFDVFIPAAYRPHPDQSRNSRYSAGQAMRWLTFLARDMEHRQQGTTDLAWWHLWGAAPKPLAGLVVGLVAGSVGALTIPWPGWGVGIVSANLVGLLARKRMWSGRPSLAAGLAGGLLGGLLAACIALVVFGAGAGNDRLSSFLAGSLGVAVAMSPMCRFDVGLLGAFVGELVIATYERASAFDSVRQSVGNGAYLINRLALGLVAALAAGLFNRRVPARGLRWSPVGFACGTGGGLVFGFVVGITAGPGIGLTSGAAGTIAGGLAGALYEAAVPTDLTKAVAPSTVLARDRTTFLVSFALAIPFALSLTLGTALSPPDPFSGSHSGFGYALGVGMGVLIPMGLGFAFLQASWGTFSLTRLWLAASGRLPLRLMRFLDDAHTNRGVLRQVGAVYQFRHVDLQRRLAGRSRQ